MNIIDKYVENLRENERLYDKIKKLCGAYLMSCNDVWRRMKHFVATEVVSWTFSNGNPGEISITFKAIDVKTKEEIETTVCTVTNNILVGEEFVEK